MWGEIELAVRAMTAPGPNRRHRRDQRQEHDDVARRRAAPGAWARVRSWAATSASRFADHADEPFDAVVLEVSSFQMERVDDFHPARERAAQRHRRPPRPLRRASTSTRARRATPSAGRPTGTGPSFPSATRPAWRQARRGTGPGRDVRSACGCSTLPTTRSSTDVPETAIRARRNGPRRRSQRAERGRRHRLRAPVRRPAVHNSRRCCAAPQGLPHRTALVAEVRGVRFYDDSKGTNVGASVTALEGLPEAAGRAHRRGPRQGAAAYGPLVDALSRKGRGVVVIGEAADAIARALGNRAAHPPRQQHGRRRACRRRHAHCPETPYCCRPRARASTCSATTSTAATSSCAR